MIGMMGQCTLAAQETAAGWDCCARAPRCLAAAGETLQTVQATASCACLRVECRGAEMIADIADVSRCEVGTFAFVLLDLESLLRQ